MNTQIKFPSHLIKIALLINVIILVPVSIGLITGADWIGEGLGEASPARGILLSMYISITIASIIFFFKPDTKLIASLLLIQVLYKVTTPFTVGTFDNPVVITNLCVAVFHTITLYLVWKYRGVQNKNIS